MIASAGEFHFILTR